MRRILLITLGVAIMALAFSGVALAAATSQDIYDDYADNHKLDGNYTDAELEHYLNDSTHGQYDDEATRGELIALITSRLNKDRGEFPFTGMEMALLLLGAVVLVGAGVALRRATR